MDTIGDRLKDIRNKKGMTLDEVAKSVGVSRQTIQRYESGVIPNIPPDKISKLANLFNTTTDYLIDGKNSSKKSIKIPVLGRVVAGIPVEAITDIIDYEEITEELARTGDFFALQVKGESMAPRIRENDVVIVRKQSTVENKEVAIVLVNGNEATIKEVQFQENGITLIGWNPAVYTPHFYSAKDIETLPVQIIGKVVELRGKF